MDKDLSQPLAFRLKPDSLDNFYGQEHLLGKGKVLRKLIEEDKIRSLILYGPSGTGKSLIAHIIARKTNANFFQINAVLSNVNEIRDIIKRAQFELNFNQKRSILFIDEIHRFNKAQQDALLPSVESGEMILIGATTYNPFFYIIPALRSRSLIFEFKPLDKKALENILFYALTNKEKGLGKYNIEITEEAREILIDSAGGDARKLLNNLECAFLLIKKEEKEKYIITREIIEEVLQQKYAIYDRDGDYHYDIISAFIKSIRGSDPDAAIYYLARMLAGGEDPLFIARRLVILASEDIGNAEPMALVVAQSCFDAVNHIGMPEAEIILAHVTTYLASLPKSNSSYKAIKEARKDIEDGLILPVPAHLKDASYSGAHSIGHGKGYKYPHDYKYHFVNQVYAPLNKKYYKPGELGYEKKLKAFLEFLEKLKKQ